MTDNKYCTVHGEMHGDCCKTEEENTLLPCPFYGGEAYREVKHDILHVGY